MKALQSCGAALLRVLATVLMVVWQLGVADATSPFNVLAPWQLPFPTPTTIGGVKSSSAPTGDCANGIDTSGNLLYTNCSSTSGATSIDAAGATAITNGNTSGNYILYETTAGNVGAQSPGLLSYVSTNASVSRTLAARGADYVDLNDYSGIATAATQASTNKGTLLVPYGSYTLASAYSLPAGTYNVDVDPGTTFGSTVNMSNLFAFQNTPIWAPQIYSNSYSSSYNSYDNIFQVASYAVANTTAPTVAFAGEGVANISMSQAWGGNFIGVANISGGIAYGAEIDAEIWASGGQAVGLLLAAYGNYHLNDALQIQTGTSGAVPANGIIFNEGSGFQPASGALITSTSGTSAQYALNFLGSYSTDEAVFPSFIIGPTPSSVNSSLQVNGGNSSTDVSIQVVGTGSSPATNQNLDIYALGSGHVQIKNLGTGTNADFLCANSSGGVLIQSSACTISSKRFKKQLGYLSDADALADVLALRPSIFRMRETNPPNKDPNWDRVQVGLYAEDVAKVDPRASIFENDLKTPKSYRQESILALTVGAIQAEHREIEALRREFIARRVVARRRHHHYH